MKEKEVIKLSIGLIVYSYLTNLFPLDIVVLTSFLVFKTNKVKEQHKKESRKC